MIKRTHISEAPWSIIHADEKKKARLNCIAHLLNQIPYEDIARDTAELPKREHSPDYTRQTLPPELFVPEIY